MEQRNIELFNTPLELSLRTLFLLDASSFECMDIDRLTYYDHLLLYSSDVENGPKSLHPHLPLRSVAIFVKRDILKKSLLILISKELVEVNFTKEGVLYSITNIGKAVIDLMTTDYSNEMKKVAIWVSQKFDNYNDERLKLFINNNLENWGGGFTKESLFREYEFE